MAPTIEIMHRISPEFGKWTCDDFKNTLLRSPLEHYEKRTQDIRYRATGHPKTAMIRAFCLALFVFLGGDTCDDFCALEYNPVSKCRTRLTNLI